MTLLIKLEFLEEVPGSQVRMGTEYCEREWEQE